MIYGVDFSTSLADVLSQRLLKKYQENPFGLSKVRIILPTKRACKSLKEAFLKYSQGKSILLPQMIPLYEMDKLATDIPEAISKYERLFLLTKLCRAKPNLHDTSKAFQVALSLTELLDLSYQYQADFSQLETLVPIENFAEHWQNTVQFLEIIRSYWPKILSEQGKIDSQDRLQRLIFRQAQHIKKGTDTPDLIIAGLTADFPSVAQLMSAILDKKGEIFLDGVDLTYLLSGKEPDENHPQFLIYKTLKALKVSPNHLEMLSDKSPQEEFIQQAFRQDFWTPSDISADTLSQMQLILSDSEEQEALCIALILRQVLEEKDKTACLVTPNRTLSRRVINHMKRWHIQLDDSAGVPFQHTPSGSFLMQILQFAQNQENPAYALALYKHPLFANGEERGAFHIKIKNLEQQARQKDEVKLNYTPCPEGKEFLTLFQNNEAYSFKSLLQQHMALAEEWARTDTTSGSEILWQSDYGKALYTILGDILTYADILGDISTEEYAVLLDMLLQKESARLNYGYNQRIKILGPIENRFTHFDVCLIGGLNEQVFPPMAESGPWLNPSMLQSLNMPTPQSKITTMAHDFMHALASPKVYLTRATKVSGTPTITSRFLERLLALAQVNKIPFPTVYAHLAKLVETPKQKDKIERPAPCPEVSVRPNQLSATNVELLKKNPYAIYAKYILGLKPLNDLGSPSKMSLYGQIVHKTLSEWITLPPQKRLQQNLITLFNELLNQSVLSKADKVFYKIVFEKYIAPFIAKNETELRPSLTLTVSELNGRITLPLPSGPFTLTARADRIDISPQKTATIIDYKTGTVPSFQKVIQGNAPQLPIESFILQEGGFEGLDKMKVSDIAYWKVGRNCKISLLSKSKNPPSMDHLIQETKTGISNLLEAFRQKETPYEVSPISSLEPTYDDYKNLSRNPEWQHEEESEDND